jgi:NAD(P)-dependent dehydrogenase (short-subunit alcohol dehydrogenase family)
MNTDRFVVITGAAGGVGALLTKRFLANGDAVLATDTAEDALDRLREDPPHPRPAPHPAPSARRTPPPPADQPESLNILADLFGGANKLVF